MGSKKDEKAAAAWEAFLSGLTEEAAAAVGMPPGPAPAQAAEGHDAEADYTAWRASLVSSEAVDDLLGPEDAESTPPPRDQMRFVILESTDGELPLVRIFKDHVGFARRLGALEGSDVGIACCLGFALQVTRGPQRYVVGLPDDTAIAIPIYEGAPVRVLDADLVPDLPLQEDGYLGPPELAAGGDPSLKLAKGRKKAARKADVDDEEDD